MIQTNITLNGKKYKLQHPGNREWIKLKKTFFSFDENGKGSIDMEPLLDFSFEHVVFPEEGNKLDLDSIPFDDLEAWESILPRFFRGNVKEGEKFKSK